jgi:hypothetical protein
MFTVWEYKVVSLNFFSPPTGQGFDLRLQVALNFFGSEGWDLGGLIGGDDNDVFLSFKRPEDYARDC